MKQPISVVICDFFAIRERYAVNSCSGNSTLNNSRLGECLFVVIIVHHQVDQERVVGSLCS